MKNSPLKSEMMADRALIDVDDHLSLIPHLTPTNLKEQKKAFLKDEIEQPQFTYSLPNEKQALELIKKLNRVDIPETPFGHLLLKKKNEMLNFIAAGLAIGKPAFPSLSEKVYGLPSPDVINHAEQILAQLKNVDTNYSDDFVGSYDVVHAFKVSLRAHGLHDWKVVSNPRLVTSARVFFAQRTIYVKDNVKFSRERIAPLITHEIDTHVLCGLNGFEQPMSLFHSGMAGYIRTQEGLATYNVAQLYPDLMRPKLRWAINALAVHWAQEYDFRTVYNKVLKIIKEKRKAFTVTLRVKRGLGDTSMPGAFTKDYNYLAGHLEIEEYVANGGKLRDLFVGKINLADLETLNTFDWIKPPLMLPSFIH